MSLIAFSLAKNHPFFGGYKDLPTWPFDEFSYEMGMIFAHPSALMRETK